MPAPSILFAAELRPFQCTGLPMQRNHRRRWLRRRPTASCPTLSRAVDAADVPLAMTPAPADGNAEVGDLRIAYTLHFVGAIVDFWADSCISEFIWFSAFHRCRLPTHLSDLRRGTPPGRSSPVIAVNKNGGCRQCGGRRPPHCLHPPFCWSYRRLLH